MLDLGSELFLLSIINLHLSLIAKLRVRVGWLIIKSDQKS